MKVRAVGARSWGWAEAAISWGAEVEAVVPEEQDNQLLRSKFDIHAVHDYATAAHATLPPSGQWDGIVLTTIHTPQESRDLCNLLDRWRPLIVIAALPPATSRARGRKLLPWCPPSYKRTTFAPVSHPAVGGVTTARRVFYHLHRYGETLPPEALMMAPQYPRTLQTALDDTLPGFGPAGGRRGGGLTLEPPGEPGRPGDGDIAGTVTILGQESRHTVWDGEGRAPDISQMQGKQIWVKANSCMSPSRRVVRPLKYHEVLSLWDYEGKLESQFWSGREREAILRKRLQSPPAKMLRSFLFAACERAAGWRKGGGPTNESEDDLAGVTAAVPYSPLELKEGEQGAATKADDADIDLTTWSPPGESPEVGQARQVLRRFAVRWWAHHQTRLAREWLQKQSPPSQADIDGVNDCLRRVAGCTYWDWTRGSRIFFWKIPDEWRGDFRNGVPFWRLSEPPKGYMRNHPSPSREAELATRIKIFKLRYQWFLERGHVTLVVPRFATVKLVVDGVVKEIRVVWDCTANGHNNTLWAPGFMLPSFQEAADLVVKWLPISVGEYLSRGSPVIEYTQSEQTFTKTWLGDIDVGAMFHNFQAHLSDRSSLGARVIHTNNNGSVEEEEFERFGVLNFGNKCSPVIAFQGECRILELAQRPPQDETSEFQWDRAVPNLPFSREYDPSLPRVMLLRKDGELATRQKTYVDDCRVAARGRDRCWLACKQLKSGMNTRGNQASDRKYRPPGLAKGPWKGEIIHTDTPFPMKSTTGKKWGKFRTGLLAIQALGGETGFIDTVSLRRTAGLGVNVTDVYPEGRCYLKGFFNALEAFRAGRDPDGWRLAESWDEARELDSRGVADAMVGQDYPLVTRITSELRAHVDALLSLFASEAPLALPLRPTDKGKLRYVGGDASAEGFSWATQYPSGRLETRHGLWEEAFARGGSNLREAQNQVNHLLADVRAGRHDGCEVWCVTDNAVWAAVWNKGMSSAQHLFSLVVDLKVACRDHEVWLHLLHISGDRMIACGLDGISRGNHDAGVALGYDLRTFITVDRGAFELEGPLLTRWCKSWMGLDYTPPLGIGGWFWEGHQPGVHIWSPPPAAALVALTELASARLKRPYACTHVFLCQRLCWDEEWRRRFGKEVDLWFFLNPGTFWPHRHLEPLIVGISFPLSRSRPWLVRELREEVVEAGRALSALSKTCHVQVGNYLRQLWLRPRVLPPLPRRVVRGVLHSSRT